MSCWHIRMPTSSDRFERISPNLGLVFSEGIIPK